MTAVALVAGLSLMGSPDYRVREFGSAVVGRILAADPGLARRAVEGVARDGSPEATRRCVRLLAAWRHRVAADYVPKSVPVWPCLDMLVGLTLPTGTAVGQSDKTVWYAAACQDPVGGPRFGGSPYWWAWRRGTELLVRRLLADGLAAPAEVDDLLARAWEVEWHWHRPANAMCAGLDGFLMRAEMLSWTTWIGYPRPTLRPVPAQ